MIYDALRHALMLPRAIAAAYERYGYMRHYSDAAAFHACYDIRHADAFVFALRYAAAISLFFFA